MSFIKANFSIPKSTRTAFAPRVSKYRDELAALTAGTNESLLVAVTTTEEATKAKQRFSSAVAQYRKATGDKDSFAIRAFSVNAGEVVGFDVNADESYVGVWRIGPKGKADNSAEVAEDQAV